MRRALVQDRSVHGMSRVGRWQTLLAASFTVLSAGLIALAAHKGTPLQFSDERDYVELATNMSNGRGYQMYGLPTAYRPPGWPVVIAAFLYVGMPVHLLSVLSAIAMIMAAALVAVIGVKLSGSHLGAVAGIAGLLYPINIYTATVLYPQSLATLLIAAIWLLAICISAESSEPEQAWKLPTFYALLGLLAAWLALSVPTLAFAGMVVIIWILVTKKGGRIRAAAYILTAYLVPLVLWIARNQLALGSPVVLSSSTGYNLLVGNNSSATGSSGVDVDLSPFLANASKMSEIDREKYLRESAIDWFMSHPVDGVTLYISKLANYFAPYNMPVTAGQGSELQRWIAYVSCALLIVLITVRFVLRRFLPLQRTEKLFIALFIANAPVMAIFITRTRFRQPLDTVLLIEASLALCLIIMAIADRHRADRRHSQP